jgi:hypothetical protein
MMDFIETENDGPLIVRTNFWESPEAPAGKYMVSANAGAFRLLLPRSLEPALAEMRTALGVAISRGPCPSLGLADAFELLFDDGSSDPYALHCSPSSFDRLPTDENIGGRWTFTVWTYPLVMQLELPCRYRRSSVLPDLRPWDEP